MPKKVLLVRLDKIGDLVCTLPVDQSLDTRNYEISWAIAEGLGFIASHADPARLFREFSLDKKKSFEKFRNFVRELKPEVAVVFYAPWWASFALFLEGVPVRAGRLSQWHSFLFLNKKIRQSRSRPNTHEAQYNQELLDFALDRSRHQSAGVLRLKADDSDVLSKNSLSKNSYWVVHPGMAGSALNWPQSSYAELIKKLSESAPVVITGTKADESSLTEIRSSLIGHKDIHWLVDQLSKDDLLGVLQNAKAVVAPSTGVLHLAASLGAQTLGLFPPMPGQGPTRWAPRGEHAQVMTPNIECPATQNCLGNSCSHFNCMKLIEPTAVAERLKQMIGEK